MPLQRGADVFIYKIYFVNLFSVIKLKCSVMKLTFLNSYSQKIIVFNSDKTYK